MNESRPTSNPLPRLGHKDRQQLREKQRELKKEILECQDDNTLKTLHIRNNELWDMVGHPQEAVLDGYNSMLISEKSSKNAAKVVKPPRYDAKRLAEAVSRKYTTQAGFDWQRLGIQVKPLFKRDVPRGSVSFLNGPLDTGYHPPKERNIRQKRKHQSESEDEVETPEVISQPVARGESLSTVKERIKAIKVTIKTKANEGTAMVTAQMTQEASELVEIAKCEASRINMEDVLFHPKSFTKTVENILDFSHSLTHGKVGISVRTADEMNEIKRKTGVSLMPGPVLHHAKRSSSKRLSKEDGPTQAILSFTMKDYKDLCEIHKLSVASTGSAILPPQELVDDTVPRHQEVHSEDDIDDSDDDKTVPYVREMEDSSYERTSDPPTIVATPALVTPEKQKRSSPVTTDRLCNSHAPCGQKSPTTSFKLNAPGGKLGLSYVVVNAKTYRGAEITSIEEDSPIRDKINVGDVLVKMNGKDIVCKNDISGKWEMNCNRTFDVVRNSETLPTDKDTLNSTVDTAAAFIDTKKPCANLKRAFPIEGGKQLTTKSKSISASPKPVHQFVACPSKLVAGVEEGDNDFSTEQLGVKVKSNPCLLKTTNVPSIMVDQDNDVNQRRSSSRKKFTPTLFVARPSKQGLGVEEGDQLWKWMK